MHTEFHDMVTSYDLWLNEGDQSVLSCFCRGLKGQALDAWKELLLTESSRDQSVFETTLLLALVEEILGEDAAENQEKYLQNTKKS